MPGGGWIREGGGEWGVEGEGPGEWIYYEREVLEVVHEE